MRHTRTKRPRGRRGRKSKKEKKKTQINRRRKRKKEQFSAKGYDLFNSEGATLVVKLVLTGSGTAFLNWRVVELF